MKDRNNVFECTYIFIKIQVGPKMKINAIKTIDIKYTRIRYGQIFINNINDEIKHVIILNRS